MIGHADVVTAAPNSKRTDGVDCHAISEALYPRKTLRLGIYVSG